MEIQYRMHLKRGFNHPEGKKRATEIQTKASPFTFGTVTFLSRAVSEICLGAASSCLLLAC